MATAKELLDAGQLQAAIKEVTQEVKSKPSEMRQRTFLFELLCFAGDYDRAEKQLEVVGHQSAQAELGVQVYRNNLKAERDRRRLFSEGLAPHFLTEPPHYVDLHVSAINRVREGNFEEAREILDRAEEERPALSGKLDDEPFSDFRDSDDLVGPVLELIVHDKYTWVPFEQIKQIKITAPRQLRDLMWTPARIEAIDGTIGEVFIPALYVLSSDHANDQVKLGRMTDWIKINELLNLPKGLRLFLVDGEDRAMLEVANIQFDEVQVATGV